MYDIFITRDFYNKFYKLDKSIQKKIVKSINQLRNNPFSGKPLSYKFFREKKIKNYRFYYFVYEEYVVVFIVDISTKKNQKQTIHKIKALLPHYHDEIEKLFRSKE